MNQRMPALLLLSLFASTPVFAQPAQNNAEKIRNQQEVKWNAQERRDDRLDLVELRNALSRFDQAARIHRPGLMSEVDTSVLMLLGQELRESSEELRRDHLEARGSAQELGSSRTDVAYDAALAAPPAVTRDDLRDTRKDRMDTREDLADLGQERDAYTRKRALAHDYRYLAHRHDDRSVYRKRNILVQLVGIAEQELAADRKERIEDRQERKEDHRRGR